MVPSGTELGPPIGLKIGERVKGNPPLGSGGLSRRLGGDRGFAEAGKVVQSFADSSPTQPLRNGSLGQTLVGGNCHSITSM